MFASPLVKVAFRYGVIGAFLCMGFVCTLYYLDRHPFLINPFVDPRVPVFAVMLFFGLKEVREYYLGGTLYFWQGMIGSFLFTLVCASLCWLMLIAFATVEPGFVQRFVTQAIEQTKAFSAEDIDRIGRGTYEQTIQELEKADRYFMASRYFFQSFILSFFISLIISVVLRRQPNP